MPPGKWTEADDFINIALLQRAKEGDITSQFQVGLFYFNGKHGFDDGNGPKSVWWLEQASALGCQKAKSALGRCYVRGFGVEKSYSKALTLFSEAAAFNDPTALAGMGYLLMDDSNLEDGDGDPMVDYSSTKCDIVKDDKEAFRCLKLAADLGSDWGQSNLAHMYLNGRGTTQNEQIAIELCKRAASGGYYGAQTTLGWCYVNGKGTQRDPVQAAFWYRMAAEQGDKDAQNWLGWAYETGIGVKKDVKVAGNWYARASSKGCKEASKRKSFSPVFCTPAKEITL